VTHCIMLGNSLVKASKSRMSAFHPNQPFASGGWAHRLRWRKWRKLAGPTCRAGCLSTTLNVLGHLLDQPAILYFLAHAAGEQTVAKPPLADIRSATWWIPQEWLKWVESGHSVAARTFMSAI